MKTVCIIQARMGSKRLPGKVLMPLGDRPVLQHVVDRCKRSSADEVVLAISSDSMGHPHMQEFAKRAGVSIYYGPENDVLSRYYQVARLFSADTVVRVTGDCPLIDWQTINAVAALRRDEHADYCANEPYIDGLGMECFTMDALRQAHEGDRTPYEREHVTPWMRANMPRQAALFDYERPVNLSIDTPEDLERVRQVMTDLGTDCRTPEIVEWIDRR
jgi:spore coat polysaccharide biosynthesis protein SpsF